MPETFLGKDAAAEDTVVDADRLFIHERKFRARHDWIINELDVFAHHVHDWEELGMGERQC
jgi:hypothetical protein